MDGRSPPCKHMLLPRMTRYCHFHSARDPHTHVHAHAALTPLPPPPHHTHHLTSPPPWHGAVSGHKTALQDMFLACKYKCIAYTAAAMVPP